MDRCKFPQGIGFTTTSYTRRTNTALRCNPLQRYRVPVFNFTLTTSSSFPASPFFVVEAPLFEPLPFPSFLEMLASIDRLPLSFLIALEVLVGSFSIFAWRRLLLLARAESPFDACPLMDKEASDADGEAGVELLAPRENVTERLDFVDEAPFFFVWLST